MTPNEFRELALSFTGATEGQHMQHPDFRAHGKIFATLGYPDTTTGMVKLTLDEQQHLVATHPHVFYPAKGAWGLQGSTMVHLAVATPDLIANALDLAWRNSAVVTKAKSRRKSN